MPWTRSRGWLLFPAAFILLLAFAGHASANPQPPRPPAPKLVVYKTAELDKVRTWTWEIRKSVTPSARVMFDGDVSQHRYTVTLTPKWSDGNVLSGKVCVKNTGTAPAKALTIHDRVQSSTDGFFWQTVTSDWLDTSGNSVLDPGEAACYPYSIPFNAREGVEYRNLAYVYLQGSPRARALAPFSTPTEVTKEIDRTIDVEDKLDTAPYLTESWTVTPDGPLVRTYVRELSCPERAGEVVNTATIKQTGKSASATVKITCGKLSLSKTAAGTNALAYDWTINKLVKEDGIFVDPDSSVDFTGDAGTQTEVTYRIRWLRKDPTSTKSVTGSITIINPLSVPAKITSLTDLITPGDIAGTIETDCSTPLVVPAATTTEPGKVTCDYEATGAFDVGKENTNTATMIRERVKYVINPDGTTTPTANGSDPALKATAKFTFATEETDECASISDDKYAGSVSHVSGATIGSLPATNVCSSGVADYVVKKTFPDCGERTESTNTVELTEGDSGTKRTDSVTVVLTSNECEPEEPCLKVKKELTGPFYKDGTLLTKIPIALPRQYRSGGTNQNPIFTTQASEGEWYFTAKITLQNCGEVELTGLKVVDKFSNQAKPLDPSDGGVITGSDGLNVPGFSKETVTWTIASLAAGASKVLTLKIATEFNSGASGRGLLAPTGDGGETIAINGQDTDAETSVTATSTSPALEVELPVITLTNAAVPGPPPNPCTGTPWINYKLQNGNTFDKCATFSLSATMVMAQDPAP